MKKSRLKLDTTSSTDPNHNDNHHAKFDFHLWLNEPPVTTSSATRLDFLIAIGLVCLANIVLPLLIALITWGVSYLVWHFNNNVLYPPKYRTYLPALYLFTTSLTLPIYIIYLRQIFHKPMHHEFDVQTIRASRPAKTKPNHRRHFHHFSRHCKSTNKKGR